MLDISELHAELRHDVGKGASRRLRREAGLIPAIIYGGGEDPTSITLPHNKIIRALEDEAFYSSVLTLNIDKKKEKVILKDLQRHPYRREILHIDFLRIKSDEKLQMSVPLHFIGEDIAPGVKIDGGVITHHINEVEIRCLPSNLPQFIEVDLSKLNLNETIHLTDIKMPDNVEILTLIQDPENDLSVAAINPPRVAVETEESSETPETEITKESKEKSSESEKSDSK